MGLRLKELFNFKDAYKFIVYHTDGPMLAFRLWCVLMQEQFQVHLLW